MSEVRVRQKDGVITIREGGNEPVTRTVTDHLVTVAEKDLERFLASVEGSHVVAKPATEKKG